MEREDWLYSQNLDAGHVVCVCIQNRVGFQCHLSIYKNQSNSKHKKSETDHEEVRWKSEGSISIMYSLNCKLIPIQNQII
jgi:hypothetical protein